jgi:hypothetical protein
MAMRFFAVLALAGLAIAQTLERLTFEVSSIKPAKAGERGIMDRPPLMVALREQLGLRRKAGGELTGARR